MVNTDILFRIAHEAEEAGDYDFARNTFELGALLGDSMCLCRFAYFFDIALGVEVDKARAMHLYRRAWRIDRNVAAGSNIAILYREVKNWRQTFRWWHLVAEVGDGSAQLEMAKCYLHGQGVKRDPEAPLRYLAAAQRSIYISDYDRELARRISRRLRPRQV